jgi:ubiquinone/menaquinone biosynthesis C-methylase UbiE
MAGFNGFLYVGTLNPQRGFQIWKARPYGRSPYRWKKVIDDGAGRGNLSECAISMCAFKGALYVGTGIQNGGYDRVHKVGPAAAEIIRIYPDDSWDVVVGEPRWTIHGRKTPLGGMGPGFDDLFNGYIWRMAAHEGWLYAGTYNWSVFLPYLPIDRWNSRHAAALKRMGLENIVASVGGFDLWRTRDGVDWSPVTRRGFGNPHNYGARTMMSTPYGLFVGTANPFGPELATKGPNGWTYVVNPRGGLEVWLGRSRADSGRRAEVNGEGGDARHWPSQSIRPTHGATALAERPDIDHINQIFDRVMFSPIVQEYYGHSDFANFGYWTDKTDNQRQACINLMKALLRLLPNKDGTILDVACGRGATTTYLLSDFDSVRVTGINISERQLASCRAKASGCRFLHMDATRLDFPDESFTNILCVEAAFHFNTREDFLREAYRVLERGGYLALSDILFKSPEAEASRPSRDIRNFLAGPRAYAELLRQIGFDEVVVLDCTRQCPIQFRKHVKNYLRKRSLRQPGERRRLSTLRLAATLGAIMTRDIRHYLLVSARKP